MDTQTLWTFVSNSCGLRPSSAMDVPSEIVSSVGRRSVAAALNFFSSGEDTLSPHAIAFQQPPPVRWCLLGFLRLESGNVSFLMESGGKFYSLDAEMHNDAYYGTLLLAQYDSKTAEYLVVDALRVNGHDVRKKFYPLRLDLVRLVLAKSGAKTEASAVETRFDDHRMRSTFPQGLRWVFRGGAVSVRTLYRKSVVFALRPDDNLVLLFRHTTGSEILSCHSTVACDAVDAKKVTCTEGRSSFSR